MTAHLQEAEKQILEALLKDFVDRGLTAKDLEQRYEGPHAPSLQVAICSDSGISIADFDLALVDLEHKKLISTGLSMDPTTPIADTLFIGTISIREYPALTKSGYEAAQRLF